VNCDGKCRETLPYKALLQVAGCCAKKKVVEPQAREWPHDTPVPKLGMTGSEKGLIKIIENK